MSKTFIFNNKFIEEFTTGLHYFTIGLSIGTHHSRRWTFSFSPGWGIIFISFPWLSKKEYDCNDDINFGFYYNDKTFWLNFYKKTYCFHLPWSWDWTRTSYLTDFNKRLFNKTELELLESIVNNLDFVKSDWWMSETYKTKYRIYPWEKKWKDLLHIENHPYKYKLKNGLVQTRNAEIYIAEREWRWRWFKWLKYPRKIWRAIEINFDGEVGERTGSWKGGTIGCSYEMKPGEEIIDTLKRMEKERIFN